MLGVLLGSINNQRGIGELEAPLICAVFCGEGTPGVPHMIRRVRLVLVQLHVTRFRPLLAGVDENL